MSRHTQIATLAVVGVLLPSVAHAHGEQVLLLPFGQIIALVAVGLFSIRIASALPVFLSGLAAAVLTWFLPGSPLALSKAQLFLLGLGPPSATAILVAAVRRLGRKAGRAQQFIQAKTTFPKENP